MVAAQHLADGTNQSESPAVLSERIDTLPERTKFAPLLVFGALITPEWLPHLGVGERSLAFGDDRGASGVPGYCVTSR